MALSFEQTVYLLASIYPVKFESNNSDWPNQIVALAVGAFG